MVLTIAARLAQCSNSACGCSAPLFVFCSANLKLARLGMHVSIFRISIGGRGLRREGKGLVIVVGRALVFSLHKQSCN